MISYAIEYRSRPPDRHKWDDDDWGNLVWFRDLKDARKDLRECRKAHGKIFQYRLLKMVSEVIG